jgi:chemotaxis protein histidine kinase CheA
MPIYQYQGAHYDLPDGLSNEEAIAKIKTHLGQSTTPTPAQSATQTPAQLGVPDSTPMPYTAPTKSRWDDALAGESGLAQTAGGLLGAATLGPLAMGTQAASKLWNGGRLPNQKEMEQAFGEGSDILPSMVRSISGPKGIQAGENMGNAMNEILPGAMHLHTMHVEGAGVIDPSTALAMRADKTVKPTPNVAAPTGNPILDALNKIDSSAQPNTTATIDPNTAMYKWQAEQREAALQAEQQRVNGTITVDSQGRAATEGQGGNPALAPQSPMARMASELGAGEANPEGFGKRSGVSDMANQLLMGDRETVDTLSPAEQSLKRPQDAQEFIDQRNAEHDRIAQELEAQRQATVEQQRQSAERDTNRAQASNMDSSPSAEAQAHLDQIAAEEQHRAHLEETHAHALDEQNRLEAAQKAVEDRQKAIDDSMSGVKSQFEGIRDLLAAKEPRNGNLAFEAEVRRLMDEAPTKSKAQVLREAKEKAAADKQRIVEQRAANEEMIQKIRDQHTESEIRTKQAQADAQEAIAKRNQANEADTAKAASEAAALRAHAEALAADQKKRDIALAKQAKQWELQEIPHPAGSKERAAAVKAINAKYSGKTGGTAKKSVNKPATTNLAGDDVNTSKSKEAGLFGADKDGITELHSGIPLPKEIRDRLDNGMKYLADLADRRFGEPLTQAKNYVANSFKEARDVVGAVGNVTAPKDIIARAIAPGAEDIPLNPEATMKLPFNRRFNYGALSESVQSGLNMAALKFKENPVLRGVQEYLNTGLARTNYQISKIVVPLNKMINRLSPADIITHDGILQREQKRGQAFTDDQLRAAGLSDKNLAAYKMQREAYESTYKIQNEQLKRMGEKELSREDYYYSSRWTGDYHAPIFKDRIGVDGKPIIDPATNKPKQDLVWHIRTETRADGERALAYLKENYPELNIHKDGVQTKMMFIGDNRNPNAPRDIANTYRDMMGYLKDNPEATESISKIMESYLEGQGYKSVGQSKHFMVKTGIRGFAGDTPWLTPEESALKGTKSQIDYLKNAIRWANLQETVANAKEVLSHPDVVKNQPNAVALAQTILNRELGKDTNVVAPIENWVAKTFGVSRNSVLRLVGDVKGMTYLQTLGLNPMYSLATALQFSVSGPVMHMVMSTEGGYKTGIAGAAKTLAFGMTDATAGILAHMAHEMGTDTVEGFISKAGMTNIGKAALKFMEDSGYIKRNIFDESRHVGQHGFMDKVQAGLGWTIGKPEQVARMMSFMSFVHHLDASGAFHGDHMAIFHEAEIYSDRALSSFKSFDRPLMIDKLGAIGQAGYVYQSFKFQSFHTTNAAFRMAARGNWKPVLTLMAAYGLGTGLMNMPGMQELDGAVEGVKDLIAKMKPDWYTPEVRDFDLRDQMINHLPTTKIFRQMSARSLATNGLAGEATGLNIAPHVSPQILDTEHLSNNFPGAVMAQEIKEWGSIGKMVLHPNTSSVTEAAYKNLPGVKGPMEEFLPNIKQGNTPGHQVFINPNDMNSPKTMPYTRNQDDEAARKINAVSAREGNLKQNWYRSNMEDTRIKEALSGNISGFLGAYHRGNVGDMADYIKAYVKLDPESTRIDEAVNNGIPAQYMSQEDQRVANAKKLLVLQAIQRYRSMPK